MGVLVKSFVATVVLGFLVCPALAQPIEVFISGGASNQTFYLASFDIAGIPQWWFSGTPLSCARGSLAVLLGCFLVSPLFIAHDAANRRADDGGVLGDARIKDGAEVIRGSDTWNGRSEPKSRGYVYGFARGAYLYESGAPHVFVCGQTGSGKTRYQNIATLDLLTFGEGGWNVVVSDVKNELIELCGDAVAARGYKVLLLDVQRPARGHRYNPLKLVCDYAAAGDAQGAAQAAEDVAAALVPEEREGQATHWVTPALGYLSPEEFERANWPGEECRPMAA